MHIIDVGATCNAFIFSAYMYSVYLREENIGTVLYVLLRYISR